MGQGLGGIYDDELAVLDEERRAHSIAVGFKAAGAAQLVSPELRSDLVAAATLHDIGYGYPTTGFHALDGARHLAEAGYSPLVCHLVVHHSASGLEAAERGLEPAIFDPFGIDRDVGPAHSVLWWADMTTGPGGEDMTVEERLKDICGRYESDDIISRFVRRARDVLLAAGQSPTGSIQISS